MLHNYMGITIFSSCYPHKLIPTKKLEKTEILGTSNSLESGRLDFSYIRASLFLSSGNPNVCFSTTYGSSLFRCYRYRTGKDPERIPQAVGGKESIS